MCHFSSCDICTLAQTHPKLVKASAKISACKIMRVCTHNYTYRYMNHACVWTRRSRQHYYYVLTKHTQKGHLPALAANPRRIRIPVAFPSHCCSSPPPPTQTLPSCRAAAHSSKRGAAAALQATQLRSISITFQISEFGHRIVFPVTELRGIYLPITHAALSTLSGGIGNRAVEFQLIFQFNLF